jgi:hypothetical protein
MSSRGSYGTTACCVLAPDFVACGGELAGERLDSTMVTLFFEEDLVGAMAIS